MVKVPGIVRDIAAVIVLIVLIWAAGSVCSELGLMGNYPPRTTAFVLQVLVIDQNGTLLPNQTVYMLACQQKPAGWTTPTQYVNNVSLSGATNADGFGEIETGNFTLTRGDIVWLGASTDMALLEADYTNKSFGAGRIGKWASFNYGNVSHAGDLGLKYARLVFVRDSDGRMIDVNQFIQERGVMFPPREYIEYFRYMDNHSWTYPS